MTARIVFCLVLAALLTPFMGLSQEDAAQLKEDEAVLKAAGLETDGRALLEFFRKRTPDEAARGQIAKLIEQLDSKEFAARDNATRKLTEIGPPALPALRTAMKGASLEVTRRAETCMDEIERTIKRGVPEAALRLLAARKPDGACTVLFHYLPFAEAEAVEEEALDALVAVGLRDGRPDPALVAALKDKASLRRAAGALVVGRSQDAAERAAVRSLLKDNEAQVRLCAGRGLVFGREKDGVPVLIALLGDPSLPLAMQAEDVLVGIAGDQSPAMWLGGTDREKCRQAWAAWWQANEARTDLAKIDLHRRPRLPVVAAPPKNKRPDVIYVPTPQDVVDKALELAKVRKRDVVYDLGCGDGRVVVTAAKKYGTYGFGFEIDLQRIEDSNKNAQQHKVERLVAFRHADIFTLDLREATVIYLYLLPSLNVKLIPQLEKLRPGTRIVSHDFDMQGVKPDQVLAFPAKDDFNNMREHRLYLWTTPLKKAR